MTHRLFRSVVLSSLVLLEGVGCSLSHRDGPLPLPDADPGGDGGPPPTDGRPLGRDSGWLDDAGRLRDAGAVRDAWIARRDAAAPIDDAGEVSTDAGPDAGDLRMCEDGWPPTKGFFCVLQDERVNCCGPFTAFEDGGTGELECCLLPESP